jgi:hypothetical protein
VRRGDFIILLGGAVFARPITTRAQQTAGVQNTQWSNGPRVEKQWISPLETLAARQQR